MAKTASAQESIEAFLSKLGRGRVPAVLVTRFDADAGEDLFGRDRLLREVRRAVIGEHDPVFAETVFDAPSVGLAEILDAAREVSLMAPRRFVLVRGSRLEGGGAAASAEEGADGEGRDAPADRIEAREREDAGAGPKRGTRARTAVPAGRDEDAAQLAVLDRYMAGPSDAASILFLGCPWDGRRRIHKAVLAAATVIDTGRPDVREIPAWIADHVSRSGGRIAPDAAALLAELRGNDTMRLASEIEKLLVHAGPGTAISAEDVRALVGAGEATSAWSLGEALADADAAGAVLALRRLIAEGEAAPMIVGALASRLRQLVVLSEERASGRPNDAARKIVFPGRSIFFADALARKSARFPEGALARALASLYDVDRRLKSSSINPEALLEEWLLSTLRSAGSVRSS